MIYDTSDVEIDEASAGTNLPDLARIFPIRFLPEEISYCSRLWCPSRQWVIAVKIYYYLLPGRWQFSRCSAGVPHATCNPPHAPFLTHTSRGRSENPAALHIPRLVHTHRVRWYIVYRAEKSTAGMYGRMSEPMSKRLGGLVMGPLLFVALAGLFASVAASSPSKVSMQFALQL